MANPIRLLILLSDNSSERMDLSRVPDTVEELIEQVKESCKVAGGIRLQYKDVDFGGTFVNLNSTSMIKDLTTIKVIPSATETLLLEFVESDLDTSSISTHTDDTVILSSSSSEKLRTEPWPKSSTSHNSLLKQKVNLRKGMRNTQRTKPGSHLHRKCCPTFWKDWQRRFSPTRRTPVMQTWVTLRKLWQGNIPAWGNQTPSMRATDGNSD